MDHQQINLLPDYYIKQQYRKRADLVFVILFALMIFSIIAAERYSVRDTDSIMRRYDAIQGQFDEAARTADEVFNRSINKGQLIQKAKGSISLLQIVPRSYLLGVLTRNCPESLSLTTITVSDKVIDRQVGKKTRVVTVASDKTAKPPEKKTFIDLEGTCANDADVSEYVSRLKENPVFKEVTLKYTQAYSGKEKRTSRNQKNKTESKYDPVREFFIQLQVNRDADIPELIEKMREKEKISKAATSEPSDAMTKSAENAKEADR